jgi:hypothetical protein
MTSTAHLPADLLSELLPFSESFEATSTRFLTRLARDDEDTFPRVCELHNTLDLLSASPAPMRHLVELRGGGGQGQLASVGGNTNQDAEDLLGFMLNAEFVLYALYDEYELLLNPNLSHWVSICREFERHARGHSGGDWGLRDKVLKIRAAFVRGILGEQGVNVGSEIPIDWC